MKAGRDGEARGAQAMGRRNKGKAVKEGASSLDAMDTAHGNGADAMAVEGPAGAASEPLIAAIRIDADDAAVTPSEHTSSDYYFDSYAHFGEWSPLLLRCGSLLKFGRG